MRLSGNKYNNGSLNLSNKDVLISFTNPTLELKSERKPNPEGIVVGLIQRLTISQQRQVTRLLEYGNKDYELVSGKTRNQLQMNRVLFDGPSLMKYFLYAFVGANFNDKFDSDTVRPPGGQEFGSKQHELVDHFDGAGYNVQYEAMVDRIAERIGFPKPHEEGTGHGIPNSGFGATPDYEIPGTSDFWINLTSRLFENPIGIVLEIKQQLPKGDRNNYGGVFLENCVISSHSLSTQAEQRVLTENLAMEVGRVIPLKTFAGEDIIDIERKLKEGF